MLLHIMKEVLINKNVEWAYSEKLRPISLQGNYYAITMCSLCTCICVDWGCILNISSKSSYDAICVADQHSCVDILWPIHFLRELLFLHWNTDFRSVMHFAVADDIIQCCSLIYLKPSEKCPHITMTRVSPVLLASYSSFDGFAAASAAVAASKLPPASVDGRSFSRCVRLVCS